MHLASSPKPGDVVPAVFCLEEVRPVILAHESEFRLRSAGCPGRMASFVRPPLLPAVRNLLVHAFMVFSLPLGLLPSFICLYDPRTNGFFSSPNGCSRLYTCWPVFPYTRNYWVGLHGFSHAKSLLGFFFGHIFFQPRIGHPRGGWRFFTARLRSFDAPAEHRTGTRRALPTRHHS